MPTPPTHRRRDPGSAVALLSPRPSLPLDVGVAVGMSAVGATVTVGRGMRTLAAPLVDAVAAHPPRVRGPVHPGRVLGRLSRRGRRQREDLLRAAAELLDRVVPAAAEEVVRRIDLTSIVRRYVDLDLVVTDVDLDAAVARVDLDAAVARVDLDDVVRRLDLTAIVRDRLDLDSVVEQVDLDAAVARVDLDAVVSQVDVDAVVARVDLAQLADLTQELIATLDLPELIRESTGAVSNDAVREMRMRSITGDEAVARAVDRLLLRRRSGSRHPVSEVPPPTGPG